MLLQKSFYNFSCLLVFCLTVVGCKEDTIIPEIYENYYLQVTPKLHVFSASGGELTVEITATKEIVSVSEGKTIENVIQDAEYTVTVSGEGFSFSDNIIYAEANTKDVRKGTVTVKIIGTDVKMLLYLTQEGIDKSDEGEDEEEGENGKKKIKVLAIGNSFSDDALEYLSQLVEANNDTIVIGNMYLASATLKQHYNNWSNNSNIYSYRKTVNGKRITTPNYTLLEAIKDEDWDFISFQQGSGYSGLYNHYFPYLTLLMDSVTEHSTNKDMEFLWHMTWAYEWGIDSYSFATYYDNNQTTMYNAIVDAASRSMKEAGIDIVIPTGTAIQNGRSSSLGDTFCRDGIHLELTYARYTASCTWYEILFERTTIGNDFLIPGMSEFQAKVAQNAAHFAVKEPFQITSLAYLVE